MLLETGEWPGRCWDHQGLPTGPDQKLGKNRDACGELRVKEMCRRWVRQDQDIKTGNKSEELGKSLHHRKDIQKLKDSDQGGVGAGGRPSGNVERA